MPQTRSNGIGNEARNSIQALSALLTAQNTLLNVYVNYETVRRNLDLDLGTMELTPEGLWIDPGKISPETLLQFPGTTLDGLIDCGCNDCGLRYTRFHANPNSLHPYTTSVTINPSLPTAYQSKNCQDWIRRLQTYRPRPCPCKNSNQPTCHSPLKCQNQPKLAQH